MDSSDKVYSISLIAIISLVFLTVGGSMLGDYFNSQNQKYVITKCIDAGRKPVINEDGNFRGCDE